MNTASFSLDRQYRFTLTRDLPDGDGKYVAFIMLNPSTATETVDDPTIRRCKAYASAWGASRLIILNLFALRATNPAALYKAKDPFGSGNTETVVAEAREADLVVCAWGNHGRYGGAGNEMLRKLRQAGIEPFCLAITKEGEPGHPLYLRSGLEPMPMVTTIRSDFRPWTDYVTCIDVQDRKDRKVCRRCEKPLDGRRTAYCSGECDRLFSQDHFWGPAGNQARRRARHTCEREGCGERSGLEVNHIVPLVGQYRATTCLNHQDNLEVLCRPHHVEVTNRQRRERSLAPIG